jgi:FkbM family methyltransferase
MEKKFNRFNWTIYQIRVMFKIIKCVKNWHEFFWKHMKKSNEQMTLRMRNGYKMNIRPSNSEMSMIIEIWSEKDYTPKGFEIKPRDTVIDIGGNIGSFSIYAATQAKNGKIYSFEPFTENYNIFKSSIEINKIKNIRLENRAIAAKGGKYKFYVFDEGNSGTSSLYNNSSKKGKEIKIDATTLPEVVKKNKIRKIDFMKIDCEGSEYEILFKLPKTILKDTEKMVIEYHDNVTKYNHKDLIKFLERNGFDVRKSGTYLYATNKKA